MHAYASKLQMPWIVRTADNTLCTRMPSFSKEHDSSTIHLPRFLCTPNCAATPLAARPGTPSASAHSSTHTHKMACPGALAAASECPQQRAHTYVHARTYTRKCSWRTCEQHGHAVYAHAPAACGGQPILQGRAESLIDVHGLIVTCTWNMRTTAVHVRSAGMEGAKSCVSTCGRCASASSSPDRGCASAQAARQSCGNLCHT